MYENEISMSIELVYIFTYIYSIEGLFFQKVLYDDTTFEREEVKVII
jgi:hypothetical protein